MKDVSDNKFNKKYQILYMDTPKEYDDIASAGNRGACFKYDLMTDEEIKCLPINEISADDSILFSWATFPKLQEDLDYIKAWNFEYKTVAFVWNKIYSSGKQFKGMGRYTRSNTEICLLATKGKPKRISANVEQTLNTIIDDENFNQYFEKTVYNGIHSKKPQIFRDRIIQLVGDLPRIEFFARTLIHGWDVFGNDPKLQSRPLEAFNL